MSKNKFDIIEKLCKEALKEASNWESHVTNYERTKISYAEAKKRVQTRIFRKYRNKIIRQWLKTVK